ncbi:MAG: hypothetical protein V4577_02065 [Bacteroidota bacterium]
MKTKSSPANQPTKPLTKAEKHVYNKLKRSFEEIKLHQEGKIELPDARSLLNKL